VPHPRAGPGHLREPSADRTVLPGFSATAATDQGRVRSFGYPHPGAGGCGSRRHGPPADEGRTGGRLGRDRPHGSATRAGPAGDPGPPAGRGSQLGTGLGPGCRAPAVRAGPAGLAVVCGMAGRGGWRRAWPAPRSRVAAPHPGCGPRCPVRGCAGGVASACVRVRVVEGAGAPLVSGGRSGKPGKDGAVRGWLARVAGACPPVRHRRGSRLWSSSSPGTSRQGPLELLVQSQRPERPLHGTARCRCVRPGVAGHGPGRLGTARSPLAGRGASRSPGGRERGNFTLAGHRPGRKDSGWLYTP
jgi:hypothetical protein